MKTLKSRGRIGTMLVVLASLCAGCVNSETSPRIKNGVVVGAVTTSGLVANQNGFSFPNFVASQSPEQFDMTDVVSMFGSSKKICKNGKLPCVLVAQAATWARLVNEGRVSGHCEGFAVMSAARFAQKLTPVSIQLKNSGDVTHGIMRGFATQFMQSVQKEISAWGKKTMREKVNAIQTSLAAGKEDYTIGVYSPAGGHAVLPYSISFPTVDTAKIMVYDSNWPGTDRYVLADMKKDTWAFSFSGRDPANDPNLWTGNSIALDLTSMASREAGVCPFCGDKTGASKSLFVIRSAVPSWSVKTTTGTLSPAQLNAGENTARPLRAATQEVGVSEFLVAIDSTNPVTFVLPAISHVIGVTPTVAVEFSTQGDPNSEVDVSENSIKASNSGSVITLAVGDLVATVNGTNSVINGTNPDAITVQTETKNGTAIDIVVDSSTQAVEIRTLGAPGLPPEAESQILTMKTEETYTSTVVDKNGVSTTTTKTGTLNNTTSQVVLASAISAPVVSELLPSVSERVFVLPTEETTTTTVAPTTTTTTTTTVAPSTTTTTVAPSTTTTTLPPVAPWVQHLTASGNEQSQAIDADQSGNVVVAGYYAASSFTIGNTLLSRVGGTTDVYVQKISSTGSVVWAVNIGGPGQEFVNGISVDAVGNVYLALNGIDTSLNIGGIAFTGISGNTFVKLSATGVGLWAKSFSGTSTQGYSKIAARNDVYIAGEYSGQSQHIVVGETTLPTNGDRDLFIAKLNPLNGNVLWAQRNISNGAQALIGLEVDLSGNVILNATYNSSNIVLGATTLTNQQVGLEDSYVEKFDTTGFAQWAVTQGGSGSDFGSYVSVDTRNHIFISGVTESATLKFGTSNLPTGVAQGNRSVYVIEISESGSYVLGRIIGTADQWLGGMAVDSIGNVYLLGVYNSSSLVFGDTTLPNPGSANDVYFVKLNSSLIPLWAKRFGGILTDYAEAGVVVDSLNSPVFAFDGQSTITIGTLTFTSANVDPYLVHLTPLGMFP